MNTERDRFITEYFSECWHESSDNRYCDKCYAGLSYNKKFSTWEGFGWLWEKCKEKDWWFNFVKWVERQNLYEGPDGRHYINAFWYLNLPDPDRFADAVEQYLKEK